MGEKDCVVCIGSSTNAYEDPTRELHIKTINASIQNIDMFIALWCISILFCDVHIIGVEL